MTDKKPPAWLTGTPTEMNRFEIDRADFGGGHFPGVSIGERQAAADPMTDRDRKMRTDEEARTERFVADLRASREHEDDGMDL